MSRRGPGEPKMAQEGPKMAREKPNMVPRGGVIDFSYMKVFGICGFEKIFALESFFRKLFFMNCNSDQKQTKIFALEIFFVFFFMSHFLRKMFRLENSCRILFFHELISRGPELIFRTLFFHELFSVRECVATQGRHGRCRMP